MIKLFAENGLVVDDEIVSVGFENNVIYSVNYCEGKVNFKGMIPEESFESGRLVGGIQRWRDKYVYTPFKAKAIWISDYHMRNWERIDLDFSVLGNSGFYFWGSTLIGDNIFFGGWNFSGFLKLNLNTKELKYIRVDNISPFSICYELVQINNKIYSPIKGTDRIIVLDTENDSVSDFSLNNPGYKISAMAFKDNLLWILTSGENKLISVDPQEMSLHNRIQLNEHISEVSGLCIADDEALVYSYTGMNYICRISDGRIFRKNGKNIYWATSKGDSFICSSDSGLFILKSDIEKIVDIGADSQAKFIESIKSIILNGDVSPKNQYREDEVLNLEFFIKMIIGASDDM